MHAGLERGKKVEEQLELLKAKDTRVAKVEALSGRKNVWDIPEVITQCPVSLIKCDLNEFMLSLLTIYSDETFRDKNSK